MPGIRVPSGPALPSLLAVLFAAVGGLLYMLPRDAALGHAATPRARPVRSARRHLTAPLTRHAAFTLVELVVVLAIVAVLAATVYAAGGPAREKARQQICLSHLHQLNTALVIYRSDWDGNDVGNLPSDCGFPPTHLYLRPYVKADALFQCPDVPVADITTHHMGDPKGFWTSYECGWMLDGTVPHDPLLGEVLRRRGDALVTLGDSYHYTPPSDQIEVKGFHLICRLDGSVSGHWEPVASYFWNW